jgi:hypothetical protein
MRSTRRSFIEKLGLGAGAALLAPIAQGIFDEAQGLAQVGTRKRVLFYMVGNAISLRCSTFVPPELRTAGGATLTQSTQYTWGAMLKNLEPYRDRMLLVDGLSNEIPKSQHSCGYGTLSNMACANGSAAEYGGPPGGITIDQHIGKTIGEGTRFRALLAGTSSPGMFATAAERREQHFTDTKLMFDAVFGNLITDASGVNRGALEQKLVLDKIRGDIKKLQGSFAAPERRKLEHYMSALEDFEKRQKATGLLASCKLPAAAPALPDKPAPEDRLAAMNDMLLLALTCGLTNVAALAAGTGMSHQHFHRYTKIHVGTPFESKGGVDGYGHDGCDLQGPGMDLIHNFHASLMARMAGALGQIKEGDKSIFDNTVMVYLSDSGDEHHGDHKRFPVVVLGTSGGKVKADGRYLRYPDKGKAGARSLADLWCTLSTAAGVPTDKFGAGGVEKVQGPLPEVLG